MNRVGAEQRPLWRLDELHRRTQLIARPEQRADHDPIDVRICRERLQVRGFLRETCRDRARSHDERADTRQRCRNGISQAEGEEVRFRVRPQHPKRQDDDAGERACEDGCAGGADAANRAQLLGHLVRRRRAICRFLGQRLPDDTVDRRHDGRTCQRRRLLVSRRVHDLGERAAAERRASRKHLEDDRARREEIAAWIDHLAGRLLGRHIARCAEHDAASSDIRFATVRAINLGTREAKVQELDAVRGQKHVRRFQVAMDDGTRMKGGQSRQDSQGDRQGVRGAHGTAPQTVREHLAFEQLHRDEQLAAVLAYLVDLANVRVIDARGGPRLAPEPLARVLVAAERRQRLERHRALEPLIASRIDDAHATLAKLVRERVVTDARRHQLPGRIVGNAVRGSVNHESMIISFHGGSDEGSHGGSRRGFTTGVHDGGSRRGFTTRVHDGGSRRRSHDEGSTTWVHDEGSRRGFTTGLTRGPTVNYAPWPMGRV